MPEIYKVSIALTANQVAILKHTVDSGHYATVSEAVREAVREWHFRHANRKTTRHKTRRTVKVRYKTRGKPHHARRKAG